MQDAVRAPTLQFLDWVAARPRTYGEAMEAWRSSCPRLSIWEDAIKDGLIAFEKKTPGEMKQTRVVLTARGKKLLKANGTAMPVR